MYTHYLFLPRVAGAEGGSEGGRAGLAVPRHVARLRGAADGQGVNAVGVAVTVTVVLLPTSITRGPHKDGSQATASLWHTGILLLKVLRPHHNVKNIYIVLENITVVIKAQRLNLVLLAKMTALSL